jgi:hypothetical protein
MTLASFVGRRTTPLLFAILLALPACGPFHRGGVEDGTVVFVNESIDQADVYATGPDRNPLRIGTVTGSQTATLTVPATVVSQGQVNIVARLLAGPTLTTGLFPLRAGDSMRVTLAADRRSLIALPGR